MTASGGSRAASGHRRPLLRDGVAPLGDVVSAHARVGSPAQLVSDRRALYRLAVSLMDASGGESLPDDVLDDPALRFAVGEVLAGRMPAGQLCLPPHRPYAASDQLIAGDAARVADLEPALAAVAQECGTKPALIVEGDLHFGRAVEEVRAGLGAACALVPDLFLDLVGHVAAIGILDPGRSGAVVSASSRSMPGVVLLRAGSPLDVAESFIHEAAHQRLFDMALTCDMLRADADGLEAFRPSWRHTDWPREQALAAFHTYACLAQLWRAVPADPAPVLAPHSVLPDAASRAREIGEWLFARLDLLGSDACRLVGALLERPLPLAPELRPVPLSGGTYRAGQFRVVPTGGGRCLVGVAGAVPQLFWLDRDTATVLQILAGAGESSAEEIRGEFTKRRGLETPGQAVWGALDRLVQSGLAEQRSC
jgi:hypothetical protein